MGQCRPEPITITQAPQSPSIVLVPDAMAPSGLCVPTTRLSWQLHATGFRPEEGAHPGHGGCVAARHIEGKAQQGDPGHLHLGVHSTLSGTLH